MRLLVAQVLIILAASPLPAEPVGVNDTGEDIFAEDGPWIAIPADYNGGVVTAADIIDMADLDGDPTVITDDERAMIEVLTQVLIAAPAYETQ